MQTQATPARHVSPVAMGLGAAPGSSPPLTVVRGAAGQELGCGAAALLCQVNGHLDVLDPLFHLRPRTEDRDGRQLSRPQQVKGKQVSGQIPELPGGHDDGLPLASEGQAVGHPPLVLALLDLWGETSSCYREAVSKIPGMVSDAR